MDIFWNHPLEVWVPLRTSLKIVRCSAPTGNSKWEGSTDAKTFDRKYEAQLEISEGLGGWGVKLKNLPWGYDIFETVH